jgi:signal peptidase I
MAVVTGASMRPGLRDGDRLLVDHRRTPRAGDVVVARLPTGTVVVKRAVERRETRTGAPGWWLLSDNAEEGRADSRAYGVIAAADVLAVVVTRIWPPGRRGPVPDSERA